MVELQPIFKKTYWSLAVGSLAYMFIVYSLTYPAAQRFALYANKINPSAWENVNNVEAFGFLKTQVQPFNLDTPDNETLYGWHILPPHLCLEHEVELSQSVSSGLLGDYSKSSAFNLLSNDVNARVAVVFHGNAAHLGSAQRPEMYRIILGLSTPSNPIHVLAIDYRGFGVSTGTPTEEGLITDGVSLLNFLTAGPLSVHPSRIVLIGQSLGTAVTAAVAERFMFGSPNPMAVQPALADPEPFAGIVLLASFSKLSSLILSYSFKGITPPLLWPFMSYPRVADWVLSHIVDNWDTSSRVARLTGVEPIVGNSSKYSYTSKGVNLVIVHALDDAEIPSHEGRRVWAAAVGEGRRDSCGSLTYDYKEPGGPSEVKIWESRSKQNPNVLKRVRWERVGYGGHNRVATFSVTALAVLRAFER